MLIYKHSIVAQILGCMNYCINAAWHGVDQSVALLRCNEAQVALIAAFCIVGSGVSRLDSLGFRSGEFTGQSSTVTHDHWTSFWYLWQCGQVPSPAGKWNQHLHKACQQKEAWSAGRRLRWLDFRKHKTNTSRWHGTPNHHRLWKLHTGLQATWILCFSSLPPDSRHWFTN